MNSITKIDQEQTIQEVICKTLRTQKLRAPLRMYDLTPEEMVQFLKELSRSEEDEYKRNALLQIATYVNACNILVMKRNGK